MSLIKLCNAKFIKYLLAGQFCRVTMVTMVTLVTLVTLVSRVVLDV